MAADLRKSYSEDDLPTAPWRFPLSFIPFLVLYIFLSKVRISPKVTIASNGFCLLRHTKTWLAHDIISYSGTMFSRVLACILFMDNIYATHGLETRIVVALKYVNDPCNTMSR